MRILLAESLMVQQQWNTNMKAIITKIDPLKESRHEAAYIRVYFRGEQGGWYQTDIVPKYRNYARWKPILTSGVGTKLDGLNLRSNSISKIDADSPVRLIGKVFIEPEKPMADQKALF